MKRIRQFINTLTLCLLEGAIGILLLVDPVSFTTGIIMVCGAVIALWGVLTIISYFRTEPHDAAASQKLMKGLTLVTLGGFCLLKTQWILTTFSLMAVVYGIVILLSGFAKVQWAADLLRAKKDRWFLAAISAAISIVCAAVILADPFSSTELLWLFTGIALICEAFLDLVTFFMSGEKKEDGSEKHEIIDITEVDKD